MGGKTDPMHSGISWDDATWILSCSFIIFTMQTGFGLLEAGCVSRRSEVNIMMKNAIDVIFGGLSYWIFGFGLSFGNKEGSNPFCGVGYFFVDTSSDEMGILFSTYVFQLSFATTATTIVSGAMAERTKLLSYIIFSFLNTIVYVIPAHWEWAENGFLRNLGVVDIAGSAAVHLVGGVSALVAAFMLKPRTGRFIEGLSPHQNPLPFANPANTLIGMFMLWWGWLAFNCGSTFGISGGKWKLAAKAAITTLNASMGGGVIGIVLSYIIKKGVYDVGYLVNSVLGALVSITAGCGVVRPWESLIIGSVGGVLAIVSPLLVERARIDDPVCAVAVHGVCGLWGMVCVGLFAQHDPIENTTQGRSGLFHGGGFYLLGIQTLAAVTIASWSAVLSAILLLGIKYTIGLRMTPDNERLGADYSEHGIGDGNPFEVKDNGFLCSRQPGTASVRSTGSSRPISGSSRISSVSASSIFDHSQMLNDNVHIIKRAGKSRSRVKGRFSQVIPTETLPGEISLSANNHTNNNNNNDGSTYSGTLTTIMT